MPPVGFELAISAGERPQTYALERAATGTGIISSITSLIFAQFVYSIFLPFILLQTINVCRLNRL